MEFLMKIPEGVFRTAKTPEQVAGEMRQAAAVFWVARGDVAPEDAKRLATSPSPTEGAEQGPMASELLLLGPDVGEDADFERPRHSGRELPQWDT